MVKMTKRLTELLEILCKKANGMMVWVLGISTILTSPSLLNKNEGSLKTQVVYRSDSLNPSTSLGILSLLQSAKIFVFGLGEVL